MLTVDEVLQILKKSGITGSEQMVRRWLREGKLKGERSIYRKEGWRITPVEVERFVAEQNPANGKLKQENERLKAEIDRLKRENKELREQLLQYKSNVTNSNIKNEELTKHEVEEIWGNLSPQFLQQVDVEEEDRQKIGERAYRSLIHGLFPKHSDQTKLFHSQYKRPYVCPFTNKKYTRPEKLVHAAIPWLINFSKVEFIRQQEKDQWKAEKTDSLL